MSGPVQPVQPIIIKRVKKGHGGHHGGAWKVAYADFVTAMMALFMVLWLVNSSEPVKKAVAGYFNDPAGTGKEAGNGLQGAGSETISLPKEDMGKLKEKLEQAVQQSQPLEKIKEHVVMTVTPEGLRVELLENSTGMFFQSGNAEPTQYGKDLMALLATEIGKLPNSVTMEGHTDSKAFTGRSDYSNWELSTDRANAARRWMMAHGIREGQVVQVRGYADQNLRNPGDPEDATNRRVTLIIQNRPQAGQQKNAPPLPGAVASSGSHAVVFGASGGTTGTPGSAAHAVSPPAIEAKHR